MNKKIFVISVFYLCLISKNIFADEYRQWSLEDGTTGIIYSVRYFPHESDYGVSSDCTFILVTMSCSVELIKFSDFYEINNQLVPNVMVNGYVGMGAANYIQAQAGLGSKGIALRLRSELYPFSLFNHKNYYGPFSFPDYENANWFEKISLSLSITMILPYTEDEITSEIYYQVGLGYHFW